MADSHPSVTERDIHLGYHLFLGRPPENSAVVADWLSKLKTLQEMRRTFIHSSEFRQKISRELGFGSKPLDWSPIDVEVDVPDDVLLSMLKLADGNWEIAELAGNRAKDLYKTHEKLVSSFLNTASRAGVDDGGLRLCYELKGKEPTKRGAQTNVEFKLVNRFEKVAELPEFDCFISANALQYNPPPVITFLLRTMLERLRGGGLAYFQLLTYKKGARFHAEEYLAGGSTRGSKETYVLPQVALWRIAEEANCQVLDVREDGSMGSPEIVSNAILLRKRNSASAPIVQLVPVSTNAESQR
jgi:hypothetical protein